MFILLLYTDFDECEYGLDNCGPNTVCQGKELIYNCTCADGYTDNETICGKFKIIKLVWIEQQIIFCIVYYFGK